MTYGELKAMVPLSPAGLTAALRRLADVYGLIQKSDGKWTATADGRKFIERADTVQKVALVKDQRDKLARTLLFWQEAVSPRDIPSFEAFRSLVSLPWNQHRLEAYAVIDGTEIRCDRDLTQKEVVRLYVDLLKILRNFMTPQNSRMTLLVTFDLEKGLELALARLRKHAAATGDERLTTLSEEAERKRLHILDDAIKRYLK